MEQIVQIMADLEFSVSNDLNSICDTTTNHSVDELSDNIKLNLSSALTEIRMHIENRKRLRELALVPENSFCKVLGTVAIAISGKVTNPRSVNAKGAASVSWNTNHCLNISIDNCLTTKSKANSEQLALLALLNQCVEIGLKKVKVFSSNSMLSTLAENLPIYALQGYKVQNVEMENKFLLEKLYNLILSSETSLSFLFPPVDQQILSTYESLMSTAKKETNKKMLVQ
jgi:hypothetical protein